MKTLGQIRLDHLFEAKAKSEPSDLMKTTSSFGAKDPKNTSGGKENIPSVLLFRRKAIRVYPDNVYVALYYNEQVDKYVTIPYGENVLDGHGIHEATEEERNIIEGLKVSEREYQGLLDNRKNAQKRTAEKLAPPPPEASTVAPKKKPEAKASVPKPEVSSGTFAPKPASQSKKASRQKKNNSDVNSRISVDPNRNNPEHLKAKTREYEKEWGNYKNATSSDEAVAALGRARAHLNDIEKNHSRAVRSDVENVVKTKFQQNIDRAKAAAHKKAQTRAGDSTLGNPTGDFQGLGYLAGRLGGKTVAGTAKVAGKTAIGTARIAARTGTNIGIFAKNAVQAYKQQKNAVVSRGNAVGNLFKQAAAEKLRDSEKKQAIRKSARAAIAGGPKAPKKLPSPMNVKNELVSETFTRRLEEKRSNPERLDEVLPLIGGAVAIAGRAGLGMAAKWAARKVLRKAKGLVTGPTSTKNDDDDKLKVKSGGGLSDKPTTQTYNAGDVPQASAPQIKTVTPATQQGQFNSPTQNIQYQKKLARLQENTMMQRIEHLAENLGEDIIEDGTRINGILAKKMLTVYESLNKTNKTKYMQMINEGNLAKAVSFAMRVS